MKIFDVLLMYNFQHWFRKPLQLIFLFLGVSLATTLWSSIQLLNSEAKKSYENAVTIISSNQSQLIVSVNNDLIPFENFAKLRRNEWLVTPIIEGKLPDNKKLKIIGVDPFTLSQSTSFYNSFFKTTANNREFLINRKVAFASSATIKKVSGLDLNLELIETDNLLKDYLLVDISIAEELLNRNGKISRFELTGAIPKDTKILDELGLEIKNSEINSDLKQLTKSFHLNLTAFGFLGFIVGLFIVYSTLNLSFEQRKSSFYSLRLMGISVRTIFLSSLIEIFFLSSISGLLGICFGHVLASSLLPDVASTLNNIYGAEINNQLSFSIKEIFIALLMPIIGTILISTGFLFKIYLSERNTNYKHISSTNFYYLKKFTPILVLIILLVITVIILINPTELFLSFVLIAILIISSSILLPIFLKSGLYYVNYRFEFENPILKWFFSDTLKQVKRISLSLNALMLSIAVTIGVDNMVKSFEETFSIWLDKRLITEMYVRADSDDLAIKISKETIKEKNVINVYPIIETKSFIKDTKVSVVGFKPQKLYFDNWPIISKSKDIWEKIQNSNGILINEQLHYKLNVDIGDNIQIANPSNSLNNFNSTVVGIYPDYGNSLPQIMINLNKFQYYYSNILPRNFAIDIVKGTYSDVSELIQNKYEISDKNIINQATIKEFSKNVFNKTFTVTRSLSDAMIIIATLTLLTSLISLSEIRVINLSPLWALGITRITLLKIEFAQFLLLIFIALVFAIPVGLILCFLLTNYLNVSAFGWKLPYNFYPNMWGKTFLISLLCSLLAIMLPTYLMFKNSASLMIKRYKNEC